MSDYSSAKKPAASKQLHDPSDAMAKLQSNTTGKPSDASKSTPVNDATKGKFAPGNQGWNASIDVVSKAK